MEYSRTSTNVAKSCKLHEEYEIEFLCLNPFCTLRKVLCQKCIEEDKNHSGQHRDTIIQINSFFDKLKGLIISDFYENKLKSLSINDYVNVFNQIMDKTYSQAIDELDQCLSNIQKLIFQKKVELKSISDEQKSIFSRVIESYTEILRKGSNYETRLCDMKDNYNELMGKFAQIEKIDNNEIYEKELLNFTNLLFSTVNSKNSCQEERVKTQLNSLIKEFETAISKPPRIIITDKIYEIYNYIERKVYFENLVDEALELNTVRTLKDLFLDTVEIYPNYFYNFNKYPCLYSYEGDKLYSVKLSENQAEAQVSSIDLKNYDFVLKEVSYSSVIVLPYGKVYIAGGYSSIKNSTVNSFFDMNIESNKALKLQPMLNDRYYHGMCYLKNRIYAIGGRKIGDKSDESISLSEYYDIALGKWFPIYPTRVPCHHAAVCTYADKYLFKFGGYNNQKPVNTIEKYSIDTNRWELLNVEGLKDLDFIAQAEATQINRDTIILFGGAAKLRGHPYMGITLFLRVEEDVSSNSEKKESYEITMNSKFQISNPTFFTCPKKCIIHDFSVYAFSNSQHLIKFDGSTWNELV